MLKRDVLIYCGVFLAVVTLMACSRKETGQSPDSQERPEPPAQSSEAPEVSMLPLPDMQVESEWEELEEDEEEITEFIFGEEEEARQFPADLAPAAEQQGDSTEQPVQQAPPEESASRAFAGSMEMELLRLINREREKTGVQVLGLEDSMHWAARIRAPEVMESLSHTRPLGSPYYTAFDEAGFVYAGKWHGENVTSMQFPTGSYSAEAAAAKMFEALSSSTGHYQNMVGENYSQAGIGVYVQEVDGTTYVSSAQMFSSF